MNILFLTPWYPNRTDAMDGIFIRKHAQAVARQEGCSVAVLRVKSVVGLRRFEIEEETLDGVREILVYHPVINTPILRQISAFVNFGRGCIRGWKRVVAEGWRPEVVQVNVLTRMGVVAWLLKKLKGIPYVVVEHWTRYRPGRTGYEGFLRKRLTEVACRGAHCVMPVSEDLIQCMRGKGIEAREWRVVNNVVNDFFYSDAKVSKAEDDDTLRLLCVTTADERFKNTSGTLRALKRVTQKDKRLHLTIVGLKRETVPSVGETMTRLGLGEFVTFAGEVPPEEVSRLMHKSDALVLFSNNENAPCVISEALASGLPVISTTVGGIPGMVPPEAGVLVNAGDEEALANAILHIMHGETTFNPEVIRAEGGKYSFAEVGKMLRGVYAEAVNNKSEND